MRKPDAHNLIWSIGGEAFLQLKMGEKNGRFQFYDAWVLSRLPRGRFEMSLILLPKDAFHTLGEINQNL